MAILHFAFCILHYALPSSAQVGEPVSEIVIEQEGRTVTDPAILGLIESRVGAPLQVAEVRETITHFMSLNRFDDVSVVTEAVPTGLRLRFVLTPLHPVDRIEFNGMLGLPEETLRAVVVDRFSDSPRPGQAAEISDTLREVYRRRGYVRASVTPRVVQTHDPDRATLVFSIEAGRQVLVRDVVVTEVDAEVRRPLVGAPEVKAGQPFDEDAIERELQRWEDAQRAGGYYEARASHSAQIDEQGAIVTVNLSRGPRVVVAFTGDLLPDIERTRLVPIRAEGSADEDLLEDSSLAIERYFHDQGYRDGEAVYTREERNGELVITFHVERGPRYLVRGVRVAGNTAIPEEDLLALVRLEPGEPFVRSGLTEGVNAIERLHRAQGFTRAVVKASEVVLAPERASDPDRQMEVRIEVAQGARTTVRSVAFEGHSVLDEAALRTLTMVAPGQAFSAVELAAAGERIDLEYRNRGYDGVVVTPAPTLTEDDTQADVVFRIAEGLQVLVDHIIIIGNRRISVRTIERELLLREGQPLGYSALIESRARLVALGLFRRIQISSLAHSGEPRRDVVVEVEEAPPTVFDFGGGVEGGYLLRVGEAGLAEEHFELAPRGFFQIGRRNLWGKNRSVNFFTRVSLRSRDSVPVDPVPDSPDQVESDYGFNEYRVTGQFREPRAFNTTAELAVTGIVEQAIRSSFNFSRREARAQALFPLTRGYSFAGIYSFQTIELFDEQFTPDEQPIIDRLFPEVRLSKMSGSFIRDSRDDALDASRGTLMVVDGDLAARAIGSEVGFVRTYLQGFYYYRVPTVRRTVLALGARIGLAHGFAREVEGEIVQDLPASERFFSGGDTSVRGFALDRLGDERTITPTGFPTGGNGVVVLNSELRVNVFGPLQAVGFVDAGNVFPRASDLSFTDLRPTAGFGVMYRSPVGPLRVDVGFNLDRQEFVPGSPERRTIVHILLGPAF